MQLGNAILRRLALRPLRTVVVDDQRSWPAWQVWWTACHVASAIERASTADRVGIMLPTSGLFPAATLGAWMAGRTCVPLNYLFTPQDMEHVCRDASIDCCVTVGPMLLGAAAPVHILTPSSTVRRVVNMTAVAVADAADVAARA